MEAKDKAGLHVSAKLQKGVPDLHVELDEAVTKKIAEAAGKGKITISLDRLDVDLAHNQSFGMMRASTGCISNPGGPGC